MKKSMIVSVLLMVLLHAAPQQALADDTLWDKTKAGASTAWESTASLVDDALAWTVERSSAMWEATSKAAGNAATWTGKKAEKGWQTAREATNNNKG